MDSFTIAHVKLEVEDVRGASVAEFGLHGLQAVEAAGAEEELCAVTGELHGCCSADTGACAGYEYDLVFQ